MPAQLVRGGGGGRGRDADEQGAIKMACKIRGESPDKVSGCAYQN